MKTILFSDLAGNLGFRIKAMIETELSHHSLVCCTHTTELIEVIRNTSGDEAIAVLAPPQRTSLNELVFMAEMLNRLKIVLVLPDHHSKTIALGHSLRPRVVTFADGDLTTLAAIVNKMAAAAIQTPAGKEDGDHVKHGHCQG